VIQIFACLVLSHIFHFKEHANNVLIRNFAKIVVTIQTNVKNVNLGISQTKMVNVKPAIELTPQYSHVKIVN
jgi:hypothetical protein